MCSCRPGTTGKDISPSPRRETLHHRTIYMLLPSLLASHHGRVVCLISHCARPTKADPSGLSRLSGWSDWKFIQKNQTDQKDQPTRQTNPGALREHRRSTDHPPLTLQARSQPLPKGRARESSTARVERAHSYCARSASTEDSRACPVTPTQAHSPSPLLFLQTIDRGPARPPT